ncbi:hypothetical protein CALCODRAFT_443798, partial [Calocera cornea HHB12733]
FNKEQACGDRNNLVFIVMEDKALTMQEAIDFIGEMWHARFQDFLADRRNLPSWGRDLDRQVATYVQGLADWVSGNLHWSFASHRYFPNNGEDIKLHRIVELLPTIGKD